MADALALPASRSGPPRGRRVLRSAVLLLGLIVAAVLLGPLLSPHGFDDPQWERILAPPSFEHGHWFGTDAIGRDLFVRTLVAGRISLAVGFAATLVALTIGVAWGLVAGYAGGRLDAWMMRAVDVLYALPFMFLVILLMVMFGRQAWLIFVAIGGYVWLDMARIVRGQTLALKEREFVEAARALGVSDMAIVLRHILPNLAGIIVVYATLTVPKVILVESFLSFLGLGIQEPSTSWGALVSEGAQDMQHAPWTLVFPAALLALTLFALNFLGDALRDRLDPRSAPR
jgi:oligopeptide transport system permease protein